MKLIYFFFFLDTKDYIKILNFLSIIKKHNIFNAYDEDFLINLVNQVEINLKNSKNYKYYKNFKIEEKSFKIVKLKNLKELKFYLKFYYLNKINYD